MQNNLWEELEAIRLADPERRLHAEAIIDFARKHPRSAAYEHFEWDPDTGAEQYRLVQARRLIRVFVQVIPTEPTNKPFRAYVHLTSSKDPSEDDGRGYGATVDVLKDSDLRRQLILTVLGRVASLLNGYPMPELDPLIKLVHKMLKQF